ncbi:GDSL-like lipase/acylhydrolase family protein [Mucilaginibacter yixingensis]|uniref:GDSL-like lipase/acylhydrolase family protein n=1 Tax=Mucilaginibacter yixingensis TaxID=1295612 RepID=A0A2T5JAL7_9SPHI|nr:GDSL-type esterase/lipase family protein [Mucilaginibacter yixingensis]PTQ97904.1 GDSL-like lipase/acylhydrolase family protein [Mucilaginibacter yixingensis]
MAAGNTNPSISKVKKRWFRLMACLLPFVFLALAEGMLRLTGYGHDTSLFVPYPNDAGKLVMNRYASERYFSDTVNATKGYYEPFEKKKAPGTLRLFVLGESTAAGYPYFHNGSFHRWLQYRLMHALPAQRVEVINLSLTAVNSYTVLDFARQLSALQPDAVLVYVGHNEYYGALGVASTSRIGSNPAMIDLLLNLRRLRLVQLIDNAIYGFKNSGRKSTDARENLMKRMAAKQAIPLNSDDYKAGITQFENNMSALCRLFAKNKVPLFLSTLVSNEKDLYPLTSADNGPLSADKAFEAGNKAYSNGQFDKAKADYQQAKEDDELRFRAPEAMNGIIRKLANSYPNVHLVDVRSTFEQASPHGILGNETLLEHVHPNLYGYALMADAYYQSLKQNHIIQPDAGHEMTFAQLGQQMPVTRVDSLFGAYQVMMLKAGWPFNQPIPANFKRGNSVEEQLAGALSVGNVTWGQANDALFRNSMAKGDKRTALRATEAALLETPDNSQYYIYAARLNFDLGNYAESEFYFTRLYQLDASFQNAQNLFLFDIKSDQPEKALGLLDTLISKNTSQRNFEPYRAMLAGIVTNKNKATNAGNRLAIASAYEQLGEPELASKYRK